MKNARAFALAITLLIGGEGFSSKPYKDSGGKLTRGYGSLVRRDEDNKPVTQAEALEMLQTELSEYAQCVDNALPDLPDNKRAALYSFVYNVGCTEFKKSTLLRYIKQGRAEHEIEAQWMRWVHVNGAVNKGLINRRKNEWKVYSEKNL